jgi:hypothetical protein
MFYMGLLTGTIWFFACIWAVSLLREIRDSQKQLVKLASKK